MAETKHSATQRIQVGLIGLVIVLLFVSLANMALERASDAPPVTTMPSGMEPSAGGGAPAGEPLAELGVTPAAPEAQDKLPGAPDATTSNVRSTSTNPKR